MSRKRRAAPTTGDSDLDIGASLPISDEESSGSGSDHSFDISSALTQRRVALKKGKAPLVSHNDGTDDDTEFEEMIRNSISRRNVKDGTELLKNTKGKKKLAKGEVGGGSFQSMGITSVAIGTTYDLTWVFFRAFTMDSTLPDAPRFPYTHPNPATFYPCSSFQPASRSGGNGPHRVRQESGFPHSSR
jgi:hypothetical protein